MAWPCRDFYDNVSIEVSVAMNQQSFTLKYYLLESNGCVDDQDFIWLTGRMGKSTCELVPWEHQHLQNFNAMEMTVFQKGSVWLKTGFYTSDTLKDFLASQFGSLDFE